MRRLYQEDVYLKQTEATILSVLSDPMELKALGAKEVDSSLCLILDQTLFFPEGGGQPSDLGQIGAWPVVYVFEKDDIVYHQILSDSTDPETHKHQGVPQAGMMVSCQLDWDRRFRHMQRHCGEHILSAVFYDLCGGVNRGFHMGEDYMTIDIRLELRPDIQKMTEELISEVEWKANQMVWENLPVSTRYFQTKEEAIEIPMRKELTIDEAIILVCVGDQSNASGCVACCGTHPSTTGQVGLIQIYKWENYKGMYRITFDAGANALTRSREHAEILKVLGQRFSCDAYGLSDKIDAREQKQRELRQEYNQLKQAYLQEQKVEILEESLKSGAPLLIREYTALKPDDLVAISRLLQENLPKLLLLVAAGDNTVILTGNGEVDCGKIVKDNAGVWNGKGGGRPDNARATFQKREDLDCFLSFLSKAYGAN